MQDKVIASKMAFACPLGALFVVVPIVASHAQTANVPDANPPTVNAPTAEASSAGDTAPNLQAADADPASAAAASPALGNDPPGYPPPNAPVPIPAAPEHRPIPPATAPAQTGAQSQASASGERRNQPGIAPHAPFYYKNKGPKIDSTHYDIRYEEDFSYLADPHAKRDFVSPLKFIPLDQSGSSYITLNALQRSFAEQSVVEIGPHGRPGYTHQHDYEFRNEFGVDVHLTQYFRAYADIINAPFSGEEAFMGSGAFRNQARC